MSSQTIEHRKMPKYACFIQQNVGQTVQMPMRRDLTLPDSKYCKRRVLKRKAQSPLCKVQVRCGNAGVQKVLETPTLNL